MRYWAAVGIWGTLTLLSPGAFATAPENEASFDCGQARNYVEKAICSSVELRQADRKLAEAYTALLAALDPIARDRLKKEQRSWLKVRDRRVLPDKPLDTSALTGTLTGRTGYLSRRLERLNSDKNGPRLPSGKAYAICDEVARLADERKLHDLELPLNDDAEKNRETMAATKYSTEARSYRLPQPATQNRKVLAVPMALSPDFSTVIDADEAVRKGDEYRHLDPSYEGELPSNEDGEHVRQHLLLVQGELVVINYSLDPEDNDPVFASWFGGKYQQPLCTFRRTVVRTTGADGICRAVAERRAQVLPWRETVAPAEVVGLKPSYGELGAAVRTDLDGDGIKETVGQWFAYQMLDAADARELLILLGSKWAKNNPLLSASWKNAKVVEYGGRGYLLNGNGDVYVLRNSELSGVCKGENHLEIDASYIPR